MHLLKMLPKADAAKSELQTCIAHQSIEELSKLFFG